MDRRRRNPSKYNFRGELPLIHLLTFKTNKQTQAAAAAAAAATAAAAAAAIAVAAAVAADGVWGYLYGLGFIFRV